MIKCQDVLIKFMDKNLPQQEIRSAQIIGSARLEVRRDDLFLSVNHMTPNGYVVKQINFNLSDVKEYVCDRIENLILTVPDPDKIPGEWYAKK